MILVQIVNKSRISLDNLKNINVYITNCELHYRQTQFGRIFKDNSMVCIHYINLS